jgi:hypothetical protein
MKTFVSQPPATSGFAPISRLAARLRSAWLDINSDSRWLADHLVSSPSAGIPPQAERVLVGSEKASVWVENCGQPGQYAIIGQASSGDSTRRRQLVVADDGANRPQLAARSVGREVFRIDLQGSANWQQLPQPIPLGWTPSGSGWAPALLPPPPPPPSVPPGAPPPASTDLCGLPDSTLFMSTNTGGPVNVLMLAPNSANWSLLPPLLMSDGLQSSRLKQLAATGSQLFALAQASSGRLELRMLQHPERTQTTFDPASGLFVAGSGSWQSVTLPPSVSTLMDIAPANEGRIYLAASNQIYLVDGGNCQAIPAPPGKYWAATSSGFEVRELAVTGGAIAPKGIIADSRGNLYLNRQVNGLSTFYKYVPGATGKPGYFRMLPPISRPGSAEGVAHDFAGYLYVRLCVPGAPDQVLFGDVDTPGRTLNYQTLPSLPSVFGKIESIGPSGAPDTSQPRYRPIYVQ